MNHEQRLLVNRFHNETVEGIRSLGQDIGYHARRFAQMVGELGAVEATRQLLNGPRTSEGFQILYFRGQLARSVEAQVVRTEYAPLFTDAERTEARRRLEEHGFDVDRYLRRREAAADGDG